MGLGVETDPGSCRRTNMVNDFKELSDLNHIPCLNKRIRNDPEEFNCCGLTDQ